MSAGALQRAMARLGQPDIIAPRSTRRAAAEAICRRRCRTMRWGRGAGSGAACNGGRSMCRPDEGVRVFMLKAAPGTKLPRHQHTGTEWTCVFEGAFRHDLGRYGAGDFDEADESVEHNPVVEEGDACICLVALQGTIELQRLARPADPALHAHLSGGMPMPPRSAPCQSRSRSSGPAAGRSACWRHYC